MGRIRRNEVLHGQPAEFSPVLFDTLFGLLVFLAILPLTQVKDGTQLAFSLVSIAVVAHAWLKRKAAEAAYGSDVGDSTLRLLFGIAEVALLQLAMLAVAQAEYVPALAYVALALLVESMQALVWRLFGSWRRSSQQRVRFIEQQLGDTVFLGLGAAAFLGGLAALAPFLAAPDLALGFGWIFAMYAALTASRELVHLKLL